MREPVLIGSREALLELFSMPMYLPRGSHFQLTGKQRKAARKARKQNWQWKHRRDVAKRALERYGLDVKGPNGKPDPVTVRLMRNARKRERLMAGGSL